MSVRDDAQMWGEKYARRADDVMRVEGEIAATIARTLRRRLSGDEKDKLAHGATDDPEAYRLYLKGRDFLVGNRPAHGLPGAGAVKSTVGKAGRRR